MSDCIGPESCSTRGFRVVVGGVLGLLWLVEVAGAFFVCCEFLGLVVVCWGSMRALL